jgi:hypothetical protein
MRRFGDNVARWTTEAMLVGIGIGILIGLALGEIW